MDPFAVKVVRTNGEQLGYLPAAVSGSSRGDGWGIASGLDCGTRYIARIAGVGSTNAGPIGASLQITYWNGSLRIQPETDPELPPLGPGTENVDDMVLHVLLELPPAAKATPGYLARACLLVAIVLLVLAWLLCLGTL